MNKNLDDLKHIRSIMERSTKFLSLSGISGIMAGTFALIGSALTYMVMYRGLAITHCIRLDIVLIAIFVVIGAASSGLYFSVKKAKKNGSKFWLPVTIQIIKDFAVPMIVGGIFCLILVYQNTTGLIGATMLIFYGIALINAGAHTYSDIKILGTCEIILGIFAGFFANYTLVLWTIGFGILHILYGIIVFLKYDKKSSSK